MGTVGELQFEVIQYRLEHECGAACRLQPLPFSKACWVTSEDARALATFIKYRAAQLVSDRDGNPVFLSESEWMLNAIMRDNPKVEFHFTSEFKRKVKA